MSGTLHLVGVGPGDPELLTLRAARVLGAADVIAYPVSNEDTTIALDIARPHLNPAALIETIQIPMTVGSPRGADASVLDAIYAESANRVAAHLDAGRDVAYLCEGDPLFYGTAIYLLSKLRDTHRIDVIPGITSMTAAAAAVQMPLAAKSENLTILAATAPDTTLRPQLELGGSFAIIKIGRHFDRLRALLEDTGHAEYAVLVERASAPQQRIARVKDLPPGDKPYFSLILSYSGAQLWQ